MSFQALRSLEAVQQLSQLARFDALGFLDGVAGELAQMGGETIDELGAQLDALRGLFSEIDRFAQKSMRLRLTLALAATPAPPQFLALFATTIVAYQADVPLLRRRMGDALARITPSTAGEVTAAAIDAAERVLAGRAALREGVLKLVAGAAAARLPSVQRASRDRSMKENDRARWGQARVDLEAIAARPEAVDAGSFAERLKKIPPPPDEPEPESPTDRFSLLEID